MAGPKAKIAKKQAEDSVELAQQQMRKDYEEGRTNEVVMAALLEKTRAKRLKEAPTTKAENLLKQYPALQKQTLVCISASGFLIVRSYFPVLIEGLIYSF